MEYIRNEKRTGEKTSGYGVSRMPPCALPGYFGYLFFVFVINWEASFFGVRLGGILAGIVLGIRALVPAILAFILIQRPKNLMQVALVSVVFFGFFFLDSSVTTRMNTGGTVLFGIVPLVGVLIPAIVVIGHFLTDCYGKYEDVR